MHRIEPNGTYLFYEEGLTATCRGSSEMALAWMERRLRRHRPAAHDAVIHPCLHLREGLVAINGGPNVLKKCSA